MMARMGTDDRLIVSIEQAVSAAPNDHTLRLHLVTLLLGAGRAADASSHCAVILEKDPNHAEALRLAAEAARAAPPVRGRLAGTAQVPLTVIDGAGASSVGAEPTDDSDDVEM